MRSTFVIASAVGIVLAGVLVAAYGFEPILRGLEAVGWGVVPVTLVRIGEAAGAAFCWWLLLERRTWRLLDACLLLRWVRESVNVLLPVAQVGGEVAGARLLTFRGVSGSESAATVVVDLLAQTVTQFFFTLIGLALLVSVGGADTLVRWVALGLAVMAPALVGFFVAQRFGGMHLLQKLVAKFAGTPQWAALGGLDAMNERLLAIYRRPAPLATVFVLHMAIWFFGVLEVWIALRFMGHPVPYSTALVIESLGQAVRGAAFVVPGGIGVQEGGFVALCAVFGIPAPVAVALSLVKRFPEIALGLPGLFIWQGLEARHLLGRRASPNSSPTSGE